MTKAEHVRKLKRLAGSRRRAAFVARGLRCDGKPRAKRKPCGCLAGSCLMCSKGSKRILLNAEVKKMWADYAAGMTLSGVGRKYGRDRKTLNGIFERRGYKLRPVKTIPALGFGVKIPEPSAAEVRVMIAGLKHLTVPAPLKIHWRKWTMPRRRSFIKKLRVKFPSTRPTLPFSGNVEPFEYGSPRAHEIVARLNVGRTSQTKVAAMKLGSEGVIWNGQLFYWIKNPQGSGDGYQRGGTPAQRVFLHHVLWEEKHGPVPAGMTVIHLDGNKNNFDPRNLALRSMADCARMNAWHRHPEKHPGIAQRIARKSWETKGRKMKTEERAAMEFLIKNKNQLRVKGFASRG